MIQWEWDLQGIEEDEEPRPGNLIFIKLNKLKCSKYTFRI